MGSSEEGHRETSEIMTQQLIVTWWTWKSGSVWIGTAVERSPLCAVHVNRFSTHLDAGTGSGTFLARCLSGLSDSLKDFDLQEKGKAAREFLALPLILVQLISGLTKKYVLRGIVSVLPSLCSSQTHRVFAQHPGDFVWRLGAGAE